MKRLKQIIINVLDNDIVTSFLGLLIFYGPILIIVLLVKLFPKN